jgi:hypothetical protein
MAAQRAGQTPWEQMPGESGPAYAAFLTYRNLGTRRSFVEAARAQGRHESLLRRWGMRHRWRERAWLWDLHEARQEETAVRQQREAVLRERLEDLDRMGRACLAFFRTMVRRDPETGEVSFDARFTPQVALRFLEVALKAQGAFDRPPPEGKSDEQPTGDLFGLADAELIELIDLARQRADQQDHRQENGNESDTTEQKQNKQEEDQPGRAEVD